MYTVNIRTNLLNKKTGLYEEKTSVETYMTEGGAREALRRIRELYRVGSQFLADDQDTLICRFAGGGDATVFIKGKRLPVTEYKIHTRSSVYKLSTDAPYSIVSAAIHYHNDNITGSIKKCGFFAECGRV